MRVAILKSFYENYLEEGMNRLGLHPYIQRLYRTYLPAISDSERTIDFRGIEATFRTETVEEINYVRKGVVEEELVTDVLDELKRGDVVADIGAHIGLFTCFIEKAMPGDGKVIALEPNPNNFDCLEANIKRNGGNADAYPIAISDQDGEVELSIPEEGVSTVSSLSGESETTINVSSKTGDSFFTELDVVPNIVKIDVEGAELKALNGLEETLTHPECRLVYCEVHLVSLPKQGGRPEDIAKILDGYGYECEKISQKEDMTFHVKGIKKDDTN